MVLTGMDSRNVAMTMDLVQAKLLLALLRLPGWTEMVTASNEVQKDGFSVLAPDAEAARSSFVSVLGQVLCNIVHVSKLTPPVDPTVVVKDGVPQTSKELVN